MHNSDWDNLRYVLAVIEKGSVSAAARELGVNHATVIRRIAFEENFGGVLFEKSATGYKPLPDRVPLLDAMRDVEASVLSVRRLMAGAEASLSGVVRVSSTDTICQLVLPKIVKDIQASFAMLKIELLSSNKHADFARMQADLFVRPAQSLPDEMGAELAGTLYFAAYSTPEARDIWLGLNGPLSNSTAGVWLSKNVPPDRISGGSDSFMVLRQMADAGVGIAVLPTFVAEPSSSLCLREDLMPVLDVPIWVGSHRDFEEAPRISAVKRQIADGVAASEVLLQSRPGFANQSDVATR